MRVTGNYTYALGGIPGEMPSRALVKLARRDGGDSWFRLAILSSSNGRAGGLFRLLVADTEFRVVPHGRTFLLRLAELIGSANREDEIAALVQGLDALPEGERTLAHDLARALIAKLPPAGREQFSRLGEGKALLADLLRDALKTAPDDQRHVADRVAAIRLLGLTPLTTQQDLFRDLLKVRQPQPVQAAAVETLARFDQPAVPVLLLEAWPGFSPGLRASAVEAWFSRPAWIVAFLGVGKPGETRNWDPQTRQGPVNMPWNAMSFVLGGKRYTAAYLDHPRNPKEARFSEREYGRFGSYFEYTMDEGKPLTVSYQLWLQEGLMKPEEVAALSKNFVEPVKVMVNGR